MGIFADTMARVSSIFLPPYRPPPYRSAYAHLPDAERYERPLQSHTIQRFYQADIEDALHAADGGDLSLLANLSRAVRRDGVSGGLLSTRASGLTRLPKLFRGTERVVADLETKDGRVGLFDRMFSPKELALWIGDGILSGVQLGEMIALPDRPEKVFVRLDPEFLRYQWGDNRWYYRSVGGLIHVVPGDGRWVLGTPGGLQNPWQNGSWAALSRSYIAKDHAFHFREAYSSALANPARVAYSPQGSTSEDRQDFFRRLMEWGVQTVFNLPPGWEVKLLESNGIGHKVFQETMDASDHDMMIAIAGQVVSTEGGKGFSNDKYFETIRTDLIQDDGDNACMVLNTQALRPEINRMYGAGERGTVEIDTTPPGDLTAVANSITAACEAVAAFNQQAAPYGLEINLQEIATRYRIPTRVITPRPLAPAQPLNDDVSGKPPAVSLVKTKAAA